MLLFVKSCLYLFLDIAVRYDFFCAAVQRINFFSLFITLYCLPLMLVNKVDHYTVDIICDINLCLSFFKYILFICVS